MRLFQEILALLNSDKYLDLALLGTPPNHVICHQIAGAASGISIRYSSMYLGWFSWDGFAGLGCHRYPV